MLIHGADSLDIPNYVMKRVNFSEDPNSEYKRVTTELTGGRTQTVVTRDGDEYPSVMVINKADITGDNRPVETLLVSYITAFGGLATQVRENAGHEEEHLQIYKKTFAEFRYRSLHF